MAAVAVVFSFSNKMVEKFPEIELEEIQELKENAENKRKKNYFWWGGAFYASKATGSDQMQQKLSPHVTEE